jgi:hypothetical protein
VESPRIRRNSRAVRHTRILKTVGRGYLRSRSQGQKDRGYGGSRTRHGEPTDSEP